MNARVTQVSALEARRRWQAPAAAAVLLDCREAEELKLSRIDGALHIPIGELPGRLHELDPDRELIVFCHRGVRSYAVAAFLQQQGFADVKSLAGGIDAWSREVDPRVPTY